MLFVASYASHSVKALNPISGQLCFTVGRDGQFQGPFGLALQLPSETCRLTLLYVVEFIGHSTLLYVVEFIGHSIQVVNALTGELVRRLGTGV